MQLTILESLPEVMRVGYECPCGCHPEVSHAHGGDTAYDVCCCGNEFAVGRPNEAGLVARDGFELLSEGVNASWGAALEATWLIGPSTHSAAADHNHGTRHHELAMARPGHEAEAPDSAIDPVCGMTVDRETQRAKGLVSIYEGREYFFCGKGCKLDFEEDPARYFDPSYTPSM